TGGRVDTRSRVRGAGVGVGAGVDGRAGAVIGRRGGLRALRVHRGYRDEIHQPRDAVVWSVEVLSGSGAGTRAICALLPAVCTHASCAEVRVGRREEYLGAQVVTGV